MSRRSRNVVAAFVITLLVGIIHTYGTWLNWDWKAMAGWKKLVDYIDPDDATGRKDAVQVYAVIVAGVIASITAAVGLLNLRLTRKNLEQQRELEAGRAEQQRQLAQGTALQAYYEQIGKLLTECRLRNTEHEEIRELARGQTLTVLREVDGNSKGSLLTFLQGAGLIGADNPAVSLSGADLNGANLQDAHGLTQHQLRRTVGSTQTKLPKGLNHPELWSKSFEEQFKLLQEQRSDSLYSRTGRAFAVTLDLTRNR
jgi:hypothetical protein